MNRAVEILKACGKMNNHRQRLAQFKSDLELTKKIYGENYEESTCYKTASAFITRETNLLHAAIREVEALLYVMKERKTAAN